MISFVILLNVRYRTLDYLAAFLSNKEINIRISFKNNILNKILPFEVNFLNQKNLICKKLGF